MTVLLSTADTEPIFSKLETLKKDSTVLHATQGTEDAFSHAS